MKRRAGPTADELSPNSAEQQSPARRAQDPTRHDTKSPAAEATATTCWRVEDRREISAGQRLLLLLFSLTHSSAILLHTNFDTLVRLLQPDAFDRRASFHLHFHQLQRSAIPTLTYPAISNRRPLFPASPTLLKRNPTASQHPLPISRHLRVCPIGNHTGNHADPV